jgi:hypothetical protein
MPQHLWEGVGTLRICEVCRTFQACVRGEWLPACSQICLGDPEHDEPGRRRDRRAAAEFAVARQEATNLTVPAAA